MNRLPARLAAAAAMVTPGNRAADIGTDHGYLPICLVSQGICPFVIASDLRPGPLAAARRNIAGAGLADRIELRLCDGLTGLRAGEVQTILITGMGGPLIAAILSDSAETALAADELILSPHSEPEVLRRFLHRGGWRITGETMCREKGRYYLVLRALPGQELPWKEEEYLFGRYPSRTSPEVWESWMEDRIRTAEGILEGLMQQDSGHSLARRQEIREYLDLAGRIYHERQGTDRDH